MSVDCVNHPGVAASAVCIGCRSSFCSLCTESVAGHPMCANCVAAARSSVDAGVPGAAGSVDLAQAAVPEPPEARPEPPPQVALGPLGYFRAIGAGLMAAVIGAVLWDKFVFYTHIQFGLVAVFIAYGVAAAVKKAAGGHNDGLSWVGAALAAFCMLLGYVLLANDATMADKEAAARFGSIPLLVRVPLMFPLVVKTLDFMDWVFVAIGVYEGWKVPRTP